MRRWDQIGEAKPDAWYDEAAKSVYKPEIYQMAARPFPAAISSTSHPSVTSLSWRKAREGAFRGRTHDSA